MPVEDRSRDHEYLLRILKSSEPTYVVAPMVRYSKVAFRSLCEKWGAHVVYTPMIIAEGFNRSSKARDSDFSTTQSSSIPLVVQFATNIPSELAAAVVKVSPYVAGIDLNFGCPQRWAMRQGIGAAISNGDIQIVEDLLRAATSVTIKPVGIKIRIKADLSHTIRMVRAAERCGAAWITVHGRTSEQRCRSVVNYDSIREIKRNVSIPVVANGDIVSTTDIAKVISLTGADGVMSARGVLANPAMFKYDSRAVIDCAIEYLELALGIGSETKFAIHHHHIMYLVAPVLSRVARREFSYIVSLAGIVDFFQSHGWVFVLIN